MRSTFASVLLLSALSSSLASTASPWDETCFDGKCTAETEAYTMSINGPKEIISDVSEAADWIVLGCDPVASKQDIRIVCKAPEASSGCQNLDSAGGAVNKLVRIPKECSENAFVRVAKFWVHEDQSVPSDVAAKVSAETKPVVHGLSFDVDFAAVPKPKSPIKFTFELRYNGAIKAKTPESEANAPKRRFATDVVSPRYLVI
ncbi:hypothetical protein HGRIS_009239 [Hohenbuehelia grisea]|uniref:Uncharacterized protein n=1 Tax=Hohenbuehelia grisea TaxID=104357 RepID=A0ABR3J0N6_9AGAR